ncbi:hypothetical protein JZ751_003450 [Albula glossodonta]|uniref:Uncharacterized protein n=1 Tax=Albula glossodonta TaxID=121402 RepID=A0A8T2MPY1_9TELE|nr:hypothetical protein JZ751_003450 [Albula glossodonta]
MVLIPTADPCTAPERPYTPRSCVPTLCTMLKLPAYEGQVSGLEQRLNPAGADGQTDGRSTLRSPERQPRTPAQNPNPDAQPRTTTQNPSLEPQPRSPA